MQIIVNGVLTNYQKVGTGNKNLLILHGWGRSLNEWLPIARQLNNYTSYIIDLPGFGSSPRPQESWTIYNYAEFVETLIKKLEIEEPVLVGHSFGGRIGIILGTKKDIVSKLILVDAAGIEKRSTTTKIKISLFKTSKLFLPKPLVLKFRNILGSPDYKTAGHMRDIFLKTINEDLTYLLPKINMETVLIWGNNDKEVPLWKAKLMRKLIPHATLRIVWGAGHSPELEKPREFMDILKDYL